MNSFKKEFKIIKNRSNSNFNNTSINTTGGNSQNNIPGILLNNKKLFKKINKNTVTNEDTIIYSRNSCSKNKNCNVKKTINLTTTNEITNPNETITKEGEKKKEAIYKNINTMNNLNTINLNQSTLNNTPTRPKIKQINVFRDKEINKKVTPTNKSKSLKKNKNKNLCKDFSRLDTIELLTKAEIEDPSSVLYFPKKINVKNNVGVFHKIPKLDIVKNFNIFVY